MEDAARPEDVDGDEAGVEDEVGDGVARAVDRSPHRGRERDLDQQPRARHAERARVQELGGRAPIALVKGKGTKVWDANGKEYLDFLAGIAVNSLGHCNPAIVKAIKQQAQKLLHVSNLYHIQPQSELARELCRHSFADRAFFCNSGAEANEAAIKLARRYGSAEPGKRLAGITRRSTGRIKPA